MTESLTIGRGEDCDVRVDDEYASPHHAKVTRDDAGRVWIEDLGSTNGTWLNGVRVYGPTLMTPGCVVRVGRTEIPW